MNSRFSLVLTGAWLMSASAFAATRTAEIRQIDSARKLAVVQTHQNGVRVGDSLIATAKDSTQCSLPVRSIKGSRATVDTSSCAFAAQLRVGQNLEESMIDETASTETPSRLSSGGGNRSESTNSAAIRKIGEVAAPGETIGVTVYAFYDTSDQFKGDISLQGQSDGATEHAETAFGIGAEYAQYNYHFVGFYANGAYEFGRDWKSTEYKGTTTDETSKPTLTMFLVGGGANFLITDNFYAKGGINYNFPSLSNGGIISDINGKLGFEGGVGARFLRNFNAELIYRKINMTASGKVQGVAFNFDNVNSTGFLLRGGYTF